ncbi:MAG TPA: hypothetical protein PLV56_05170 [Synergistales bacterium]|nr:hypothetical protein [Synergistales bacterium]
MQKRGFISVLAFIVIGTAVVFLLMDQGIFAQRTLDNGIKVDIPEEVYREMEKLGDQVYLYFGSLG